MQNLSRNAISIPRDMPLWAGRRLRRALELTARQITTESLKRGSKHITEESLQPAAFTLRHRRDQDPARFGAEGLFKASRLAKH